jgi:hypothetical protein
MLSEVDMLGHPNLASSFTVVCLFLNYLIHSYTLLQGKTLPPYCVESLRWISAQDTIRPQKPDHTSLFYYGANGEQNGHV